MIKYLKIILLTFLICATKLLAQIPSVAVAKVKGQYYELTELIEHNHRWYKHEPEYWTYKQLDSKYPLTIYKTDYEFNKAILKTLPDHRDFYTRHPHIQKIMFIGNMGSLALNILQVVHL